MADATLSEVVRRAVMAASMLGVGVLTGCPPVPPRPPQAQQAEVTTVGIIADAPVLGFEPVAKGVYVSIARSAPLTDEALARSRLARAEIFSAIESRVSLAVEEPATAPVRVPSEVPPDGVAQSEIGEAPPAAVKLYLQGRQRFLEGANSEAMALLEKALTLDPQGFTVLRLMGRVCFAASQLPRGAMYLQRAQALRPWDVEVNYLLGRYWLERGDHDRAAYHLMRALDSPERLQTSVHTPLSAFYLGISLQQGGYHLAAARQFEHFLTLAELPIAGYRYDGELNYLLSMKWASHLAAAENYACVEQYAPAVEHYQAAMVQRPDDPFIASRLVNALARDGQTDSARKVALRLLNVTRGSDDAVKLLGWMYNVSGRGANMISDLAQYLRESGASEQSAAITMAATQQYLGDANGAVRTLQAYLRVTPGDLDVLGRLVAMAHSEASFRELLLGGARAIEADGSLADSVVRLLTPSFERPAVADWYAGVKAQPAAGRMPLGLSSDASPALAAAASYLEALALQSQDAPAEVVAQAFEAALSWSPDFLPASEGLVNYLLVREKFSRATELVERAFARNPDDPRLWRMRIETEILQQRLVRALHIAREGCEKFPENADLRMEMVTVLRLRQQDRDADDELQKFIREQPRYEPAYRSLVNSLFQRAARRDPQVNINGIARVLNGLMAQIPNSRFGQITGAIILVQAGRADEADAILRNLVAVDPDDAESLIALAQLRQRTGRAAEAVSLLDTYLQRKASPQVLRELAALHRAQERAADALALTRRMAEAHPADERFVIVHAGELVGQGRLAEAVELLTESARRIPRSQLIADTLARLHLQSGEAEAAIVSYQEFINVNGETAERLYLLSHLFSSAGNDDASVAALQKVLTIMPDHSGANNDLGYFWADAGIHLGQAEPLIKKALDNQPDNPSFLDSLGWLYYKQGRFPEALALLQRTIAQPDGASAEVLQHLGDTLYRMGRSAEAMERWLQANQLLFGEDSLSRTERRIRDYLTAAIAAVQEGRTPVLSPLAGQSNTRTAGPATAPADEPQ